MTSDSLYKYKIDSQQQSDSGLPLSVSGRVWVPDFDKVPDSQRLTVLPRSAVLLVWLWGLADSTPSGS